MNKVIPTAIFLLMPLLSYGQNSIGFDTQMYPAGFIINGKASWQNGKSVELIGKIGYNIARRQDFGEHDKEEGGGPGLTFAYRKYLSSDFQRWYIEARAGLWFLNIDWEDNAPANSGTTDITVFQPTIGIGYDWSFSNDKMKAGVIAAFGYEVNVITNGEKVGQGGISLIGLSYSLRIN